VRYKSLQVPKRLKRKFPRGAVRERRIRQTAGDAALGASAGFAALTAVASMDGSNGARRERRLCTCVNTGVKRFKTQLSKRFEKFAFLIRKCF